MLAAVAGLAVATAASAQAPSAPEPAKADSSSASGPEARDVPDESGLIAPEHPDNDPGRGRMAPEAPAAIVTKADPAASPTVYGPPSPKSVHGKIPDIHWSPAPNGVPPALEEAIHIVTKNYPAAKSARAGLGAAASDVRSAKWQRFPRLSAGLDLARATRNQRELGNGPQPQLVVALPVWAGGRIGAEIRRTQALENATSAGYVETVQNLAINTSQTYFQIAQLVQREQLLSDSLREHMRLVGTMERRVQQEISPLADLELARSRAAQIEQEYTVTRAQRLTSLRVLAELIADPSYDLGPIPTYKPAVLEKPEALEAEAAANDPELRRLTAEIGVADAAVDARKASILPQVDVQYSYDRIFKSQIGLAVRAQNNGGLSQFADVASARLRVQSAMEDARVADQQLRREIATDIIEYNAAKDRAAISTNASETASRVSESYMRQFIAGRRSWLDVMNALREAVNAQMGKSDAEVTAMAASVRLLLRSGRWHPIFETAGSKPAE
jgi:adhesin transport system outer membrane protein